jgi:hypothetical protein
MELFTQLFGDLLAFVRHCFDRIVIYGYLSGLSRPEQVVHFFRQSLPRRKCCVSEDWRDGARLWQAVCWLRKRLMDADGERK